MKIYTVALALAVAALTPRFALAQHASIGSDGQCVYTVPSGSTTDSDTGNVLLHDKLIGNEQTACAALTGGSALPDGCGASRILLQPERCTIDVLLASVQPLLGNLRHRWGVPRPGRCFTLCCDGLSVPIQPDRGELDGPLCSR